MAEILPRNSPFEQEIHSAQHRQRLRRVDNQGTVSVYLRRMAMMPRFGHFLKVKRLFGYGKVRCRGLTKNTQRLALLFGLGNLLTAEGQLSG